MCHHRLRGSLRLALAMGKGNFRPPQNRHPLTDHQTNCHRWPLQLCQIRCTYVHGGLLGTWVKYNQNYFYLYLFWETQLQVRPVDGFSRMMCLFGICAHCSPLRGLTSLPQKNSNFGAWIYRRFRAKFAKWKNVHIIKNTASIPTKFCTVTKTIKYSSWVVQKYVKQIHDGGRPPF